MAKSKFLSKDRMKKAGGVVLRASLRGTGAVGAGYLSNRVIGDKLPKKWHSLVFLTIGLAGEVFLKNDNLNAVAQGVTIAGTQALLANNLLPDSKGDFGLAGNEDLEEAAAAAAVDALSGWSDEYGYIETMDGTPEGEPFDLPLLNGADELEEVAIGRTDEINVFS